MIRIAIVDDEIRVQEQMTQYIREYEKSSTEKFKIQTFNDAVHIVEAYKKNFDIVFMDIQMSEMDGMTAAKKIRAMDSEVIIIFVTNMAEFAIEGYKVDALSYVVKPILYLDFVQQFSKAVSRVQFSRTAYLLVSTQSDIIRLDISKILYLESVEHKIVIHTVDEEIEIYSTLKKLEKQLELYWFERCNSGFLINLSHVDSVNKNEVFIGNATLSISRGKKKIFMNALSDFIGGEFK